jgi:hypothetical protein
VSTKDAIEDYEWLVSNGVHPLLACEQIGRKPDVFARMLQRYDRHDLAGPLERWAKRKGWSAEHD